MAGSIIAGDITADTWKNSNGTENYKCRAWVNFNGTGTVAIRASGNVSSITDNGTGKYTVNFTTALQDTSYAGIVTAANRSGTSPFGSAEFRMVCGCEPQTVSSMVVGAGDNNSDSYVDGSFISVAVFR